MKQSTLPWQASSDQRYIMTKMVSGDSSCVIWLLFLCICKPLHGISRDLQYQIVAWGFGLIDLIKVSSLVFIYAGKWITTMTCLGNTKHKPYFIRANHYNVPTGNITAFFCFSPVAQERCEIRLS